MAFILRQRHFLFSSLPEGPGLTLKLVIISVLVLVIMGFAVLVYRRWKRNRTMSGNSPPDVEVPMNPVTVQPAAAATVLTYQSDYSTNLKP